MDQKPRKKPTGKKSVLTPPSEQVLCLCGHPVRSRHVEVWDAYVNPDGDISGDGEHNDAASDTFDRGLHCSQCNDFIKDDDGVPYGYEDNPSLLALGRLKLVAGQ